MRGPFVLRGSAPSSYPRTLGFVPICSFFQTFFSLSLFFNNNSVARMSVKDALFESVFIPEVARGIVYKYTWWFPHVNVNDLEELDEGRVRISL